MCILTHGWLFVTPWTVDNQALLSRGLPRQEYWSGLPFPPPGDLPDPGIKCVSPASPALAGRFLTTEPPGKSNVTERGLYPWESWIPDIYPPIHKLGQGSSSPSQNCTYSCKQTGTDHAHLLAMQKCCAPGGWVSVSRALQTLGNHKASLMSRSCSHLISP